MVQKLLLCRKKPVGDDNLWGTITFEIRVLYPCFFQFIGYEFMIAPIIDVLAQMPASGLLIVLWSLNIAMWGMLSAIFTVTCIIDSLVDAYPRCKNYRICICSVVCLFCLVINCSILNPLYYTITYMWVYTGMYILNATILVIFFLTIFVYSMDNVRDDYHFLYGHTLNQYWIFTFKMCCLICMVSKNYFIQFL